MPTIIRHILDGDEILQPRNSNDIKILATFDADSVQANITVSDLNFTNDANAAIKGWFETLPTEGMPYKMIVENAELGISVEENFYIDFHNYRVLSDVECSVTVQKDNGLVSLDDRAGGLTMQLLKYKGIFTEVDYVSVPYTVESRKRLLEFVQIQMQLYNQLKGLYDETFKLINIVSDISSGLWITTVLAGVLALVNLTNTIIAMVLLSIQVAKTLKDMQEILFPTIRYHRGIRLSNWLRKGIEYMDYEFETSDELLPILDRVILLGSKDDQIGAPAGFIDLGDLFAPVVAPGDGLLDPGNFGYTLGEAFELVHKMFYTKVAVVDGVVHIRPYNDPFWFASATYSFPDVKIEQAFTQNGGFRYNYDEMYSRILIQYAKDDSDLHTLTNVDSRISEFIQTPNTVVNQKHVNIRGLNRSDIPYALCVRKPETDALLGFFEEVKETNKETQAEMDEIYAAYPALEETSLEDLDSFTIPVKTRTGTLLVENHFFSTPKIVYLDPVFNRIPKNFADFIGADSLFTNFHAYKSFAFGWRTPGEPSDTNQKKVYDEGVRIPFGIKDYQQTILNSWFSFSEKKGKFTRIEWDIYRDTADVDFYIEENWTDNVDGILAL